MNLDYHEDIGQLPGSSTYMHIDSPEEIYLGINGKDMGPYTHMQLTLIIAKSGDLEAKLSPADYIFWHGLENWLPWPTFVDPLHNQGMSLITSDVRLNKCYNQSGVASLLDFLSMGYEKRLHHKNYGVRSEKKLIKALQKWTIKRVKLDQAILFEPEKTENKEHNLSQPTIDYEKLIKLSEPEKFLSPIEYDLLWKAIEESDFLDENVYYLCHEAGEKWPVKSKTGLVTPLSQGKKISWEEMVLRDFHGIPIKEILGIKNFGRVKLRALIKAIAYRLSNKSNAIKDKSLEEQIDWIQSNAGLTSREKEILSGRFDGQTLEEIAVDQKVTRERIRQIQKVALNKLRSPICLEVSGQYLDVNQNSIWTKLSEGKPYIPKDKSLGYLITRLSLNEKLALFIYAGEKTQGEAFARIVEGFLDRRFKEVSDHWYNHYYSEVETSAAVTLVEVKAQNARKPIALESLREGLSGFSPDLISFAVQVSNKVIFYQGFIAQKPFGTRPRRAIDAHIVLSDLEKEQTIVSTDKLLKLYTDTCPWDPCSERDLEIVMDMYPHLFFRVGIEGCISIGKSRDIAQEINFIHLEDSTVTEELEDTGEDQASGNIQTIIKIIDELGISHRNEIFEASTEKDASIPEGSLHSWLSSKKFFHRFAPSYYGARKWVEDDGIMDHGRRKIVNGSVNANVAEAQLKSYILARYAGEPIDLYPLWGHKIEHMWAQHLTKQSTSSDLLDAFTYIADPSGWEATAEELKSWGERKKNADFKLRRDLPDISNEKIVTFKELLSALIYIKENGEFSWVRANLLMGRRLDGYHSVPCLITLVLLGAVIPPKDWQQKHLALNDCSELIDELKNAYHNNPDIAGYNFGFNNREAAECNGLDEIIMPRIKNKFSVQSEGWAGQLNESALIQHFTSQPKKAKPGQTGKRDVGESISTDGFFQI